MISIGFVAKVLLQFANGKLAQVLTISFFATPLHVFVSFYVNPQTGDYIVKM